MSNKQKGFTAAASALLATLFITLFGVTGGIELSGSYAISNVSEYESVVTINVPSQFKADICELKMNDLNVDTILLPDNTFTTLPVVTSDVSRLSITFYHRGEEAGVGVFDEGGILAIKAKEEYVNETEIE